MKRCTNHQTLPASLMSAFSHVTRSVAALALTLTLFSLPLDVQAQQDNFNDGIDDGWTRYNPFGNGTWSFPGTIGDFSYRIQAGASPAPEMFGPGRSASHRAEVYSDFYISVDLVDWQTSDQGVGILARLKEVGAGMTDGYAFTYQVADTDISISIFTNEVPTDLPGSSENIFLDPAEDYRLVFMGVGNYFEGRVYKLSDLSTPLMVSRGTNDAYASGTAGLVVADLTTGGTGTADGTFDNYFATNRFEECLMGNEFADDFNDGNDTAPAPAWSHYNPFVGPCEPVSAPPTFTFPGGNSYRIISPTPFAPDCGPARAGSIRNDHVYTDFYVSVDVLDWDDTVRQAFGILVRGNTIGLQTTSGYLFSYELGGGTLPNDTGGDLDISPLLGEAPTGQIEEERNLPEGSSLHLTKGKQYRFVFLGKGLNFIAEVFELPVGAPPILLKTLHATDPNPGDPVYASGVSGLVVADQGSGSLNQGDATFDNYYSGPCPDEPRLTITREPLDGSVQISWPANQRGLWILECTPVLGPATWTAVSPSDISYDSSTGRNVYTVASPSGNNFYRLRKL